MIIDQNNMMIGRADHIREIGPHPHEWRMIGRDGAGEVYDECLLCGTRRTTAAEHSRAQRRDWLAGAAWDVNPERQTVLPASNEEVAIAMQEQREDEIEMAEDSAPREVKPAKSVDEAAKRRK